MHVASTRVLRLSQGRSALCCVGSEIEGQTVLDKSWWRPGVCLESIFAGQAPYALPTCREVGRTQGDSLWFYPTGSILSQSAPLVFRLVVCCSLCVSIGALCWGLGVASGLLVALRETRLQAYRSPLRLRRHRGGRGEGAVREHACSEIKVAS